MLTTDLVLLLRDFSARNVGASCFEVFSTAKWWIILGRTPWWKKIVVAQAKIVPVPNRASDFKLWGKEACFQFFKWIWDNIAFLIIWRMQLLFTQNIKTLLKKVWGYRCLWHHNFNNNANFNNAIRHVMHMVVLLLLILILLPETICRLSFRVFFCCSHVVGQIWPWF